MSLTARIAVSLTATLTSALDLVTSNSPTTVHHTQDFADGAGLDQASRVFSDQRTLAASAAEDLDLAGGSLSDAFGAALTFTKLKAVMIRAAKGNTNSVLVGGDAASIPIFGAVNDVIAIPPGGVFLITAPTAAGFTVTAATGDILQVANGGAGTAVTYDVVLIGA
ncbi:MAG: hypothetical protein H0U85_04180 [Gemmatimonadales bacterium]|nr:hypothetical protein [Gemmatimonadales bacterium]